MRVGSSSSDLARSSIRFGAAALVLAVLGLGFTFLPIGEPFPKPLHPALWCLLGAPIVSVLGLLFAILGLRRVQSLRHLALGAGLNLLALAVLSPIWLPALR